MKELSAEHGLQYVIISTGIVKLIQREGCEKIIPKLLSVIMEKIQRNNIYIAGHRNEISVIGITSSQNVNYTHIQNVKSVFVQDSKAAGSNQQFNIIILSLPLPRLTET